MSGPGFVCIGAQKAGTTWLYRALEHHPDIWLPPVKELHYFDEKRVAQRPWYENFRGDDGIAQRWRRQLGTERRRRANEAHRPDAEELRRWAARYFFETPTPDWYASLFPDDRLGGDITPEYALLDPAGIDAALSINPDLRVIYLLRNPIEREWSGALMRSRGLGRSTDLVLQGGRRRHARYAENLDRWNERLPAGRLYVGWFDDIARHPEALLTDLLGFLQVSTDNPTPPSGRPNSGGASTIPGRYAGPLATELGPQIRDLAHRYGGPAEGWATTAEQLEHADPTAEIPYPFVLPGGGESTGISSLIL
jgi:hypothetical protein